MSEHGGDIYRNKIEHDFSVNISPYGMPPKVRAALTNSMLELSHYPDDSYLELRKEIAKSEGLSADDILVGNGSSELIYALMRAVKSMGIFNSVGIVNPCFSEYEKAVRIAGFDCINESLLKRENLFSWDESALDELLNNSDIIILGNPNNPTGQKLPDEWINKAAKKANKSGKIIVLDESFLPLTNDYDFTKNVYDKSVIHIKTYTKSMAIPGVRIGYLICNDDDMRKHIKNQLPEWNVSIPAMYAGIASATCGEWLKEEVDDRVFGLDAERAFLAEELEKVGLVIFPSDTNFILLQCDRDLYSELLKEKILIRKCSNYKGLGDDYYRIAVKSRSENLILIEAASGVLTRGNKNNFNCDETESYRHCEAGDGEKDCNNNTKLMHVLPEDIEKTSFSILSRELSEKGIIPDRETESVVKRCIHTSADFEYAYSLAFSDNVMKIAKDLIKRGAHIVTDTNMALSGINKKELAKYGGQVHCFMADPEIARLAKEAGRTRATMSMEYAAKLDHELIFAVGNAPTALVTLCDLIDRGIFRPGLIVGVPVGFVNVEAAKEMIISRDIPYIVNRGRKGGSNIAAAIINAILYEMRNEENG